jgi:hypothetical protein
MFPLAFKAVRAWSGETQEGLSVYEHAADHRITNILTNLKDNLPCAHLTSILFSCGYLGTSPSSEYLMCLTLGKVAVLFFQIR